MRSDDALRACVHPGAAGDPEKPWPGMEGITTSNATDESPPCALGSVSGPMRSRSSTNDPGQPWISMSGTAFGSEERTAARIRKRYRPVPHLCRGVGGHVDPGVERYAQKLVARIVDRGYRTGRCARKQNGGPAAAPEDDDIPPAVRYAELRTVLVVGDARHGLNEARIRGALLPIRGHGLHGFTDNLAGRTASSRPVNDSLYRRSKPE